MSKSGKNQIQSLHKNEQFQRQINGWNNNQSTLYEFNNIENDLNSKQLDSRVTFSAESIAIKETEIPEQYGEDSVIIEKILHVEEEIRESWDNKTQFFLGVISYAVGFGNVIIF